jgi:ribosomal-protein-alanine N-acetyltransferase
VNLEITPATQATLAEVVRWRYGPPYELYDGDGKPPLNPERFFEARDGSGEFVGFYYFEERGVGTLFYGLGMRPELTGRGLGLEFVLRGLSFARERYRPRRIVLDVASFNRRALTVYERAGFRVTGSRVRRFERFGEVEFTEMELPA